MHLYMYMYIHMVRTSILLARLSKALCDEHVHVHVHVHVSTNRVLYMYMHVFLYLSTVCIHVSCVHVLCCCTPCLHTPVSGEGMNTVTSEGGEGGGGVSCGGCYLETTSLYFLVSAWCQLPFHPSCYPPPTHTHTGVNISRYM